MKLFLVRHGEADSQNFDIKDIERPLTPVGEIDASKVGKLLAKRMKSPDLIMSSTAIRTRRTTELVAEQLGYDPVNVDYKEELYETSTRILLKFINEISDEKEIVIIVAHNPAITYLAEYITGNVIGNVKPAGVVHVEYDGSWSDIAQKNATLIKYFYPDRNE